MKDETDITIILDRSGSMAKIWDDTIGGFNSFITDQRTELSPAKISLVQFDHDYEPVFAGLPLEQVPTLGRFNYIPRGSTALNDAVGRAINAAGVRLEAMAEAERPDKIVFVIITDGEENASREFTKGQIKEMIGHQENVYNWLFVYLGANVDAFAEASSYGIAVGSAANYQPSAASVQAVYSTTSNNLRDVRRGSKSVKDAFFTDKDREDIDKAGKS